MTYNFGLHSSSGSSELAPRWPPPPRPDSGRVEPRRAPLAFLVSLSYSASRSSIVTITKPSLVSSYATLYILYWPASCGSAAARSSRFIASRLARPREARRANRTRGNLPVISGNAIFFLITTSTHSRMTVERRRGRQEDDSRSDHES